MHKKTFELANPRLKITLEADDLQIFDHCQKNWEELARTLTGHFQGPSMKQVLQSQYGQKEEAKTRLDKVAVAPVDDNYPPEGTFGKITAEDVMAATGIINEVGPVQIDPEEAIALDEAAFDAALVPNPENPLQAEATEALFEDVVQPYSAGKPVVAKRRGRPKGSRNK